MDIASNMTNTHPHTPGNTATPLSATAFLRQILENLALNTKTDAQDRQTDTVQTQTATFGNVIDQLDERAFGLMILLLALPCCLPFVYLLPQLVALPMLALAAQLVIGRHVPWLPDGLKNREFEIASFKTVLDRSEKYLGFIERIARPRFSFVTNPLGIRLVAALLLIPTASILVPLPSTNTVPGIGVAITALGLIERDGLLIFGGLLIGLIWVALLGFFGLEAASIIKDWVSAHI